ncbi:MAG: hypothetical protein QM730_01670 [Anaerolineales bacterium]
MENDGIVLGELLEMRHPQSHVVQPQLAEGGVEIHLQPGSFGGERGGDVCIVWSRADELGVVAACFCFGGVQYQVERGCVKDWRFGIGHRQDHGHAASQRSGRRSIPIFLVSLSGFAHVDVGVDQAGETYHRFKSLFC